MQIVQLYTESNFNKGILLLKNLIIKSGELIINVIVIIGVLFGVISGLAMMRYSFFSGLILMITSIAGVVMLAFFVYLLIDIRDNLVEIKKQTVK